MKKKTLLLLLATSYVSATYAAKTVFNFEEATVPTEWSAKSGDLSLTKTHFKEGEQSLCWNVTGVGMLEVDITAQSYQGKTAFMLLRSAVATNDTIVVDFLDQAGKELRTARVLVNFAGWNEFNRTYAEYSNTASPNLAKVRFTLRPTDKTDARRLWFDAVDFNSAKVAKIQGSLFVLDFPQLTSDNHLLSLFANEINLPLEVPTQAELDGLELLRQRFPRVPSSGLSLVGARSITDGYKITRNADNSVTGVAIDCRRDAVTNTYIRNTLGALTTLGLRYQKPWETKTENDRKDSVRFENLLDHVLNQGFAQGYPFIISTSAYNDCRELPTWILDIASMVSGHRRNELLKFHRWFSLYGSVNMSEAQYPSGKNTDLIHNFLPHYYGQALLCEDDAMAIRELKAMKRYLERYAEITPGTVDGLKTDGCGFHHLTHYNNYMYAFNAWGTYIHNLRGTPFNVDKEGYLGFANAVRTMYLQNTRVSGGAPQFSANSLSGRNPYGKGGINLQVPLPTLENLVKVSAEILGQEDSGLGAIYNYFSKTEKFNVPAKNFDGYYQFNYSPTGIARKGDWVVTMRSPTTYFWGAEIYISQNRFGRYQSHGTMEVTYAGDRAKSGTPMTGGAGGWDWNVVPGTTTVHYDAWNDLNPGGNNNQRLDQKTIGTNFSGALAFGENGLFATDFVQGDSWGSPVFQPTNLKFKKSVFTFDDLFVALGSNISSVRTYQPNLTTATNLFQEIKSTHFNEFVVDGVGFEEGSEKTFDRTANHWFLTPLGTGYYVPKNNNDIVVKFATQSSPQETGADIAKPLNSLVAAKAYIDHGKQPAAASYHYAMVPGATKEKMENLAAQIGEDGGDLYSIEAQTEQLHAVTHHASGVTGYAFFTPASNIDFGKVISTTAEHLLMVKDISEKKILEIALTNPDLRPQADSQFRFLAQPTDAKIMLRGKYVLKNQTSGIKGVTIKGDNTELSVVMSEGMPEYATLINEEVAASKPSLAEHEWVVLHESNEGLSLRFDAQSTTNKQIRLFTPDSSLVHQSSTGNAVWNLNKSTLRTGVYLLQVETQGKSKTFKIVIR